MEKRNSSVDFTKGILIFLVIIGHAVPGSLSESIVRWIIYGFHMPLFMAVSGYMFDMDKYMQRSFRDMFKKYLRRIVIPWVCAVNIYFILNVLINENLQELSIRGYLYAYIQPYYHLWFAVVYTAYIFIIWIFLKLMKNTPLSEEKKRIILLSIAVTVSAIWKFVCIPLGIGNKPYINLIQYYLRPWLFVFFVLGMILRKTDILHRKMIQVMSCVGVIIGSIVLVLSFYIESDLISNINFFVLNLSLTYLVCSVLRKDVHIENNMVSRTVEFVGRHSYAFYLWHVLVIVLIKHFL